MRPLLDLYLYEEASAASQFSFSITGKNGNNNGMLKKLAPGHFQTDLPISKPGDYKIELSELRRERRIAFPAVKLFPPL